MIKTSRAPLRRRNRRRAEVPAGAPTAVPAGKATDLLGAPALAHTTARALRHDLVAGMQQVHGNRFAGRQLARLARAPRVEPATPAIARKDKLPPIDARRTLTPEVRALVETYWKMRRANPEWATEFHKVVDQRFWKETGYKVGKPLNPKLAADRPFCEIWLQTRDKLMAEITGDTIKDTLVLMRYSSVLIERNTAEAVASGLVRVRAFEDCAKDPKSDDVLTAAGLDKTQFVVLLNPDTGAQMIVQTNAAGFRSGSYIFVKRASSIATIRSHLMHEVNHALRPESVGKVAAASFERYKDEFQAYWVTTDFASEPDLDKRAASIKAHVLASYPLIKAAYDTDADYQKKIDAHTRPDANVINSVRWAAIEKAVEGVGVDEQAIFDNLAAMPADEKAYVRADPNFMQLLRDHLDAKQLKAAEEVLNK